MNLAVSTRVTRNGFTEAVSSWVRGICQRKVGVHSVAREINRVTVKGCALGNKLSASLEMEEDMKTNKKVLAVICAVMLFATALPMELQATLLSGGMPPSDGIMFDHWDYADIDPQIRLLVQSRDARSGTFHSPGFSTDVTIGGSSPTAFARATRFELVQQRVLTGNTIPHTRFQSWVGGQVRNHIDFEGYKWGNVFHDTKTLDSNGHGSFTVNINNRAGVRTEIQGSHRPV